MHKRKLGKSNLEVSAMGRARVVIATKFGFQIDSEKDPHPVGLNSRPEYIKETVDGLDLEPL